MELKWIMGQAPSWGKVTVLRERGTIWMDSFPDGEQASGCSLLGEVFFGA